MPNAKLVIITAPSGAGKSTMVNHLLSSFSNLSFSVSATTRKPRKNEVDGEAYYFLSQEEFQNKIKDSEFVEWEEVYDGRFYGTLKSEIEQKIEAAQNILFDIDVEGAINIQSQYPNDSLTIFIKPPNLQTLLSRLSSRKTETPESIERRIKKAKRELLYRDSFDVVIVNDHLETAFSDIDKVVSEYLNTTQHGNNGNLNN